MVDINAKESPFSPGKPVQPEYFVARIREIQRLERAIRQTISGRNENVFITGQRGIGKSSLAGFIKYIAEKEHSFVGTHCCLGGVQSLEEAMGVVFEKLLQDSTDKSLFDRLRKTFGNYIEDVTLFGVRVQFTKNKGKLMTLVDNFLPALRKIYDEAKESGKKGLILILDDINGISDVPQFSQFLKSSVDTLALSGEALPILLILVGLPERREELIKHQPSFGRIFDIVELSLISEDESREFFKVMFDKQGIDIDADALPWMVRLSGGFPMLMHEVGDAVFWQDTDKYINEIDALNGITEAAGIVGKKYIDPEISKVLQRKTYASILQKIVGKELMLGATFKRQEVLKEVPEKEQKNLDNFLRRVKKLGIIDGTEVRGEYKFVNPLYHWYVWFEAKNKAKMKSKANKCF